MDQCPCFKDVMVQTYLPCLLEIPFCCLFLRWKIDVDLCTSFYYTYWLRFCLSTPSTYRDDPYVGLCYICSWFPPFRSLHCTSVFAYLSASNADVFMLDCYTPSWLSPLMSLHYICVCIYVSFFFSFRIESSFPPTFARGFLQWKVSAVGLLLDVSTNLLVVSPIDCYSNPTTIPQHSSCIGGIIFLVIHSWMEHGVTLFVSHPLLSVHPNL